MYRTRSQRVTITASRKVGDMLERGIDLRFSPMLDLVVFCGLDDFQQWLSAT